MDKLSSMKSKFFFRGVRAYDEGIPCAPMMDPEVMKMLEELDSPIVLSLKMWFEGWTWGSR